MKKTVIGILVIMLIGLLSGCIESEYEKAGKDFDSWVNTDPNNWTDTQKDYFNDFMDWADKN
ncbi:MAG: hypothetical protein IJO09_02880 [Oscillospiraceae bacterium]|nr:hypothetical protein [Oscillospiraceae bacterium]